MVGVFINVGAIILGGALGLLLKKGLPERISDNVMLGFALVTVYVAITGMRKGENQLVAILAVVLGGAVGSLLDLDGRFRRLSERLNQKLAKGDASFSSAFVTTSLLYCVGAMAIIGPLQSGLSGDNTTLITKAVLDGVSAVVFAATLGPGVLLSAISLFLLESALTLLAGLIAPFLGDHAIAEIVCAGSIVILGMALDLMKAVKVKVVNYLPAILFAAVLAQFI